MCIAVFIHQTDLERITDGDGNEAGASRIDPVLFAEMRADWVRRESPSPSKTKTKPTLCREDPWTRKVRWWVGGEERDRVDVRLDKQLAKPTGINITIKDKYKDYIRPHLILIIHL